MLFAGEEGGFDIVDDDGIEGKKLGGSFRESGGEFAGILGIKADEDRFVKALRILLSLEATVERIATFTLAAAVIEFRLAAGDADTGPSCPFAPPPVNRGSFPSTLPARTLRRPCPPAPTPTRGRSAVGLDRPAPSLHPDPAYVVKLGTVDGDAVGGYPMTPWPTAG